jgi:hypothetical protein
MMETLTLMMDAQAHASSKRDSHAFRTLHSATPDAKRSAVMVLTSETTNAMMETLSQVTDAHPSALLSQDGTALLLQEARLSAFPTAVIR